MREFRARSRSTRAICCHVVLLVALLWLCGSFAEKCGKANKSSRKCAGKKYYLSEDLARAAELQVGSTVCRVHWDEIRRSNNRCSVPRENHSRSLRKQPIPARLFAVLDAIGATSHGYKPGTRWCYKCSTRVDGEMRFTSHPDYKPPVLRTTEQDGNKQTSDDKLQKILEFTRSPILRLHKNLKQQHSSSEDLQKVQNHFKLLFQRLKFLEEACGIDLQHPRGQQTPMVEIQTSFGVVKINCYGDVTVDKTVWARIATAIHDLNQLSENTFDQLIRKFQTSLQTHYESSDAVPLYDPGEMKDFADKSAPGLFNVILKSILREDPRLSEDHRALQEKRTVVLLYIIAYFRSQKTNTFQREEGLFIQQRGASRDVINSGRLLGFSTSPRDVDNQKSRFLREQPMFVNLQVSNALRDKSLMIYLLDDFHNIQTVRLPGANMKLSLATHMASNLLDIHQRVPAILIPSDKSKIHRIVTVNCKGQNKQCRGGIDTNYLSQLLKDCNGALKSTFLASLSDHFRSLKPRDIQAQLKEFRVYSGRSNDDLSHLSSCVLIDEFEQSLKSKEDYMNALSHSFEVAPQLKVYLQKYAVPAPGDWPTWFYFKKLIAQEVNEDSALLSMVPEQGPFHVTLNVQEDIMQIYHFLLSRVYREIFGSELPHKPKPFRINLLLNAIFLGWLQLRTKVLQKFQLCKDIEFACILHLLDEVVPLSFFHYPVIFRSGNLSSYVPVMLRFALLFIIWRRHHYDRSTLSMLSDIYHQKFNFTSYYSCKEHWMSLITEKKVEIWHSVLRAAIQAHNCADEIRKKAITLAMSKSSQAFMAQFVKPYSRGMSEKSLEAVVGKTAESLLEIIKRIGHNIGKSSLVQPKTNARGKPVGERKYHLETFNIDINSKALPLAYSFQRQNSDSLNTLPQASKLCDFKDCSAGVSEKAIRLSCFHTIHPSCMQMAHDHCPICSNLLLNEMKRLSNSFNESLLEPTKQSPGQSTTTDATPNSDDEDELPTTSHPDETSTYYQTEAWQIKIDQTLDSFEVPQPQQQQQPTQTQEQPSVPGQHHSSNSPHNATTPLNQPPIFKMAFGSAIIWFFPSQFSQSTLYGRNGSNACTFIALLLAKFYFLHKSALSLSQHMSLPLKWINLFINCISLGNHIYDSVTTRIGQYFSVQEATPFLTPVTGNVQLEDSFDLSILNENPMVPQSSLAFYLERLTKDDNLAAVVIMNGMTISLVGQNNNIIVMDSHLHGQLGAMVGIVSVDKVEELLVFVKQQLSPCFNICSLTFVNY